MIRTEGTYINGYNEERESRKNTFFNGDIQHNLIIKEYEKGSFCICLDSIDICGFNSLEEAKSFGLGLERGFSYSKEEIIEKINNLF